MVTLRTSINYFETKERPHDKVLKFNDSCGGYLKYGRSWQQIFFDQQIISKLTAHYFHHWSIH